LGCGSSAPEATALAGEGGRPATIVLITTTGLRADSLGPLTPSLNAFKEEATWSGPGLAASPRTASALASMLTGLRPWQHQVVDPGDPRLHPSRITLAEALAALGYHTAAFLPNYRLRFGHGYRQGFVDYEAAGGGSPGQYLAALDGSPTFVWIHLPEPQPPYREHAHLRSRLEVLGRLPARLPARMNWADLVPPGDGSLRPFRRIRASTLYRYEVAALDDTIGGLLAALRQSGQFAEALVVVTSLHGTELGEHGQLGSGETLYREVLEVPLIVKLPESRGLSSIPDVHHRPAISGLWATLVGAAGGVVPPALEPDVLTTPPRPVVSELYAGNGFNAFSLVDGDLQWLRTVPFAPPESAYVSARLAQRGVAAARLPSPVANPPGLPLARLRVAFEATLPFSGGELPVREALYRWSADGVGTVALPLDPTATADPQRARLARRWHAFLDQERTPGEERARLWEPPPTRASSSGAR